MSVFHRQDLQEGQERNIRAWGQSRAFVSLHMPDAAARSRRSISLHPANKSDEKLGADRSGANLMQVEVGCLPWNMECHLARSVNDNKRNS